ncbi:hypothetical protein LZ575_10045 [Antarcticibacterium sp. 1MA-6-2]|uniref:hypothetical protein n=1 Tax=Antarcticibacterium sp. 1MA-6-2 TaxID=2908210 RepID=UPI001F43B996|nr:hypothetical protein [Antarcticibacterium sp. 1MA-6-2]UJH93058.1 hypothetical protein LZ575_10045 [Antarcticibacterium sp. 1MA-6-2]
MFREKGVVEGESLEIKHSSGGWVSPDVWAHESLYEEVSGHKVMIWHAPREPNDELQLNFVWPEAGTYKVKINKVLTKEGGKFQIYLNEELGEMLDFSSGEVENATEKQKLGTVQLKPGPQQLRLQWAGEKGEGGEMRLDYLKFAKID